MKLRKLLTCLPLLLAGLLGACDEIPRDPERTLEKVLQRGELRVGLIHAPPHVDGRVSPPRGKEIDLLRDFADQLGVAPRWQVLPLDDAFEALRAGDIDVLAGGLVSASPYASYVAFTRPYSVTPPSFNDEPEQHVLAVRKGENRLLVTLEKFLRAA